MALADHLFFLPSVTGFVEQLVSDLEYRRTSLVLLPALGLERITLATELKRRLIADEKNVEILSLDDLPEVEPVSILSREFGVRWEAKKEAPRAYNLAQKDLGIHVIIIDGGNELQDSSWGTWLRFLNQWAEAARELAGRGQYPTTLCMIVNATDLLSQMPFRYRDVNIRWWWGLPSILEMQMLCRLYNVAEGENATAATLWRESLIPSLAGGNLRLADQLWKPVLEDIGSIQTALDKFAKQEGWSDENFKEIGLRLKMVDLVTIRECLDTPPAEVQPLWAKGALGWTSENALEYNAAALIYMGRKEDVNHKAWRAQASILMPVLDGIRMDLCRLMSGHYGHDWPTRWVQPVDSDLKDVQKNPMTCQWGHLECIFKKGKYGPQPESGKYLRLATLGRGLRNDLSHYKPVKFHDVVSLLKEATKL